MCELNVSSISENFAFAFVLQMLHYLCFNMVPNVLFFLAKSHITTTKLKIDF